MSRTEAILSHLQEKGSQTMAQLCRKFNVAEATMGRYLRDASIRDRIQKDDSKPTLRYMAVSAGRGTSKKEASTTRKSATKSGTAHSIPEQDLVQALLEHPKSVNDISEMFNIPEGDVEASVNAHPLANDIQRLVAKSGTTHYVLFSQLKDDNLNLEFKSTMFERKTAKTNVWTELSESTVKRYRWEYLK